MSRVWQALTDHREFGAWFRVALEGPFVPGQEVRGRITWPGAEHLTMTALATIVALAEPSWVIQGPRVGTVSAAAQEPAASRGYAHHSAAIHPRVLDETAVGGIFPHRQARA